MRRRISKIAAAICAIVGSLTSPALGQNQKGLNEKSSCTSQTRIRLEDASNFQETIFSGTVLDPVGAVIPSAIVLLQNQITKDIQQTTANENGLFQFTGMAPGKYLVKIESPGFAKYQYKNFELKKNQAVRIEVILLVDSEVAWLGIVDESSLINTPPGTTIITEKLFRSLPH